MAVKLLWELKRYLLDHSANTSLRDLISKGTVQFLHQWYLFLQINHLGSDFQSKVGKACKLAIANSSNGKQMSVRYLQCIELYNVDFSKHGKLRVKTDQFCIA